MVIDAARALWSTHFHPTAPWKRRLLDARGRLQRNEEASGRHSDYFFVESVLAGEVLVDDGLGEADFLGDLFHGGGLKAVFSKNASGDS
jgi:hypothetical protein